MDRDYSFLDSLDRGMYFDKKEYDGAPLLSYEEVKDRLPVPIVSSHPEWVDCYNSGFIYQRTPSDRGQRVCEQFRGRRV